MTPPRVEISVSLPQGGLLFNEKRSANAKTQNSFGPLIKFSEVEHSGFLYQYLVIIGVVVENIISLGNV